MSLSGTKYMFDEGRRECNGIRACLFHQREEGSGGAVVFKTNHHLIVSIYYSISKVVEANKDDIK